MQSMIIIKQFSEYKFLLATTSIFLAISSFADYALAKPLTLSEQIESGKYHLKSPKLRTLPAMPQPTVSNNGIAKKLKAKKEAAILETQQGVKLQEQRDGILRDEKNLRTQSQIAGISQNFAHNKNKVKATINAMLENRVAKPSNIQGTSNPGVVVGKLSRGNQDASLHNLFASKSTEASKNDSTSHAAFKAKIVALSTKFKAMKASNGDTKTKSDAGVSAANVAPPPPPPPPPPSLSSGTNKKAPVGDNRAKFLAVIEKGVSLKKSSTVMAAPLVDSDNNLRTKLKKTPTTPEEIAAYNEIRKTKLEASLAKRHALAAEKAEQKRQAALGKTEEEIIAEKEAAKHTKEAKWKEARKANELAVQKMEQERREMLAKNLRKDQGDQITKNNASSDRKYTSKPTALLSPSSATGTQTGQNDVSFNLDKIAFCNAEELELLLDNLSAREIQILLAEMESLLGDSIYLKTNGNMTEEQAFYQALHNSLQTVRDEALQKQGENGVEQALISDLDEAEARESLYNVFSDIMESASIEGLLEQYDQFENQDSLYRSLVEEMQTREREKSELVLEEVISTATNDEAVEAIPLDSRITLSQILNAFEHETSAEVDAGRMIKLVEAPALLNTANFVNEVIADAIGARIDFSIAVAQLEGVGASADDEDYGVKLKSLWFSALYGSSTQGKKGSYAGYKGKMAGGTIGIDAEINEATSLGLAYSNISSNFNYKQDRTGDKTTVATHALSLYSQVNFNDAFVWSNIVSVALSNTKTASKQRYNAVTRGKFKSRAFNFNTNLGYKISSGDMLFIPNVGLRYGTSKDDAYTETGAGLKNARVAGRSSDLLVGSLGAKTVLGHKTDDGLSLMPSIHASVDFNLKNKAQKVRAQYAYTGEEINVTGETGAKPSKVSFNVGGGVAAQKNNTELAVNYNLKMTKKHKAHQGSLKITVML